MGIAVFLYVQDFTKPDYFVYEVDIKPTSVSYLNQTQITSIVSNTIKESNYTIIHLSNGLDLKYENFDIKSGDSLELNMTEYKVNCGISDPSSDVQKLENNTLILYKKHIDDRCNNGFKLIEITGWNKLNQK